MSDCRGRTEESQHETRFQETLENLFTPRQQDEKGRLLSDLHDNLGQTENVHTETVYGRDDDADTSVVVDEVRKAIRRLPCGKTAGYDDLPAELADHHKTWVCV